jgi:hypothetical protein
VDGCGRPTRRQPVLQSAARLQSAGMAVQAKAASSTRSERTIVRERGSGGANAGLGRQAGQLSIETPNYADQLALNADVVVELGRVVRIRRLESDPVLLLEEALERDGVLLDLGHDDVAVARG